MTEEPKVWNVRQAGLPKDVVYVGRPTMFGNPYVIGQHGNREQVIEKHRIRLMADPAMIARVRRMLKGKHLACHCAPQACHADTLLAIANSEEGGS